MVRKRLISCLLDLSDALNGRRKSGKSFGSRGSGGGAKLQRGNPRNHDSGVQNQQHQRQSKGFNARRPHPRSSLHSSNSHASSSPDFGWEDGVALADESEVGSVFNHGSKKHNMNHLLNFQFEPRGTNQFGRNQQGRSQYHHHGSARKNKNITYRPTYKKEQYLQAK